MKAKTLTTWLQAYTQQPQNSTTQSVLCFQGAEEYPLLFFTLLYKAYAHHGTPIHSIDAVTTEWPLLEGSITTSFLGQSLVYHIKGIHLLDAKKIKKIISFLASYQGPHALILWLPDSISVAELANSMVRMPEKIDQPLMVVLAQALGFHRLVSAQRFLKMIATKSTTLSLETVCLLFAYGMVLGNDISHFNEQWLDHLLDTPPSLFTLSQHFFERNATAFGIVWHRLKDRYQAPFWVSYWSDQLFKAACFVQYKKADNAAAMKKIGFRLPFSFLSHGAKNYTYQELMRAHQALYLYDHRFKNGADPEMIELFYAQFFSRYSTSPKYPRL